MVRTAASLILAAATVAACGDPLIVLGDAPGRMRVVAGVGDSIGTRVDSIATLTKLTEPAALAFDPASGVLYVADRGAVVQVSGTTRRVARLFAVRSDGRLSLRLASSSCPGACPESIHSMAMAADGTLYLTDPISHRVFRLEPGAQTPTAIAGDGTAGDSPDGTPAAQAKLRAPTGIIVMPDGRIIFAEQAGHRVRVIETDGRLGRIAGTGTAGFSGDGGPAVEARLNNPAGLALSRDVVFIADRLNHSIRMVSLSTGVIQTLAGQGSPGFAGDNGDAINGRFDRPESLAVADDGVNLFIADAGNHRVRRVNLVSGMLVTAAGTGSNAWSGDGRPAGETSLATPLGVTCGSRFLFISDTGHSVVWRTVVLL